MCFGEEKRGGGGGPSASPTGPEPCLFQKSRAIRLGESTVTGRGIDGGRDMAMQTSVLDFYNVYSLLLRVAYEVCPGPGPGGTESEI